MQQKRRLILSTSITVMIGIVLAVSVFAQNNSSVIQVTYPRAGQRIAAVDSTFIIGSAPVGWRVTVNGHDAVTHAEGGWLAFVPLTGGKFVFDIEAFSNINGETQSASLQLPVYVPALPQTDSVAELLIYKNYRLPRISTSYLSGADVRLQFRGVPGCRAWAEISGIADSIPMIESEGTPAPFYGASVFEDSSDTDIPRILGIYQGQFKVPESAQEDSVHILYHLAPPNPASMLAYLREQPIRATNFGAVNALRFADISATDTNGMTVAFNHSAFPVTIEFTDTVQIMRVGPRRGYLGLFQPAGVRVSAIGYEGDWFVVKLSESRIGYVHRQSARRLSKGVLPPESKLRSFRSFYDDAKRRLKVSASLSARHPFSISEPEPNILVVELFGVTMDTDWFRYDFADPNIINASWTQPEPELFRLELRFAKPLWGYSATYRGTVFELTINYPPKNLRNLKGKTIVLDPGHSPDPGSIGPTQFREADANLKIALFLREELKRKGADIVMTRADTSGLPLYSRPALADSLDADLFVSIHNNALPDGVNPLESYGVSTYYYHTHSIGLARAIHSEMLKLPNQRDHGLYHGNLAVIRPTSRPSVLVECGFMIVPEQEAWLKTDDYTKRVAKAIARGVEKFFKEFDG
ncbi:N-acetylmuramoyl-L-alanine amidase [Gemmatimonas aurantiaca]|nr:N-acetylmuramoyl-L-alanine amidase [Gemmatimonas aurantiaca]